MQYALSLYQMIHELKKVEDLKAITIKKLSGISFFFLLKLQAQNTFLFYNFYTEWFVNIFRISFITHKALLLIYVSLLAFWYQQLQPYNSITKPGPDEEAKGSHLLKDRSADSFIDQPHGPKQTQICHFTTWSCNFSV